MEADADAAAEHGAERVARALIRIARVRCLAAQAALAFSGSEVEARVEALLDSRPRRDQPRAGTLLGLAALLVVVLAAVQAPRATLQLLWFAALAVLGIAIVVGLTLGSARRTLIVLSNLPLALAGGVAGVHLAGGVLSVATTIGFITLFGIATRNGILLATRAHDLELEGQPREVAAARAAQERLAPILMTAATAALGLVPLALALGRSGSEIQAPMALVILTGLVSSTALNMLVVPSLIARWGGRVQALPRRSDEAIASERGVT